ncbi:hypothetical protein ACXM2N_03420 [Corynebacterium sp. ZY180755]
MTNPYNWGGYINPENESGIHRAIRFLVLIQGHRLEKPHHRATEELHHNQKYAARYKLNMIIDTATIIVSITGAATATIKENPVTLAAFIVYLTIGAALLNWAAFQRDQFQQRILDWQERIKDIEQEVLDGR